MKPNFIFQKALILLNLIFGFIVFSVNSTGFSDKSILIQFKNSVSDPHGMLSSWVFNLHHCLWEGVTCDFKSRVLSLNITGDGSREGISFFDYPHFVMGKSSVMLGKLVGRLSPLIGKLTQLRVLSLPFNDLSGEVPIEIWSLERLELLDLEGNLFTGSLPVKFTGLRKLRVLNLGFNRHVGNIPVSLIECVSLQVLNMAGNDLNGNIPVWLVNFPALRRLYLSQNQLTGFASDIFGNNCQNLEYIDLSRNLLQGEIPPIFGSCRKLKTLVLFSSMFDGYIPRDHGNLQHLEVLDRNNLRRFELGGCVNQDMKSLIVLDLSGNNLSGTIPSSFTKLQSFSEVDILTDSISMRRILNDESQNYEYSASANVAEGGNGGLSSIGIASIISASSIILVLLALLFLFFYTRKWMPKSRVQISEMKEIMVFTDPGVPLTFNAIVQATGNFSVGKCIGNGGFGATYKAEISPGNLVAVKRLSVGRFVQGAQQFHAEIKTLGRVRHPNLVTLIGYHASQTEMFLIYNYLPGGNLEMFIQKKRSEPSVSWEVLHKIALDIAVALSYLHDECVPRVLHRDVKPSNILLDDEYNAYLSDFGLSRLMGTAETHATTGVAGTFGYVAPEYAMTCRVSEKADVYSYGVVLLELISDKKALDPSFSSHGNGFNIVSWACMLLRQGRAKDAFSNGLWNLGPCEELVEMLHLAVMCTVESLSIRPTMKQVVKRLNQIRNLSGQDG